MKKLLLSFLLVFSWLMIKAQVLTNNGTITIVGTGQLIVQGGMTNSPGSVLNMAENSLLTVSDELIISSGSIIHEGATIILNGTASSNLTSNGVVLGNLTLNKTSGDVSHLGGALNIAGDLDLTSGDLILGGNNLLMSATGTSNSGNVNSYVQAHAGGKFQKVFSASNPSFVFPIGDNDDFSPLSSVPSINTATVSASVVDDFAANTANHPNRISRNWLVNTSTGTNALLGTYVPGDIVGMASKIVGGAYPIPSTAWVMTGSTGNGTNQVGVTAPAGDVVFSGLTTIGTVKLKAYLAGAYNTGTGMMSTSLNSLGLIPLPSPYSQDATSVISIPNADITDWVLLEITNASNGGDPTLYKSAFIKKDGTIVDLNGTADPQIIGAYGSAIVRIRHRNHLSVRTDLGISTSTPSLQNFSTNTNVYSNPSVTSNGPQRNLTGTFMLWGGETNNDEYVTYLSTIDENFEDINSDALSILTHLGNNLSNIFSNTYSKFDTNLDGYVTYLSTIDENFEDINSDALTILSILGNNLSYLVQIH